MKVVVTREAGRNAEMRAWLDDEQIEEVPLTLTEFRARDELIEELQAFSRDPYQTLVVSSSRALQAIEIFRPRLAGNCVVISLGESTSRALIAHQMSVDVEATGPAADLAGAIDCGPVLIVGAREGREELANALRARGMVVDVVAVYVTKARTLSATDIEQLATCDVVFIGAPSAWRIARPHVRAATWVIVPGSTTLNAVVIDHPRVEVGWGAAWPAARDKIAKSFHG